MNTLDIILAIVILYGFVRGFFRGFIAELASLVAFVVGIYGAIHFSHILSGFLEGIVDWNIRYVNLIAFAITFVLIAFAISIAGRLLTTTVNFIALGILNKLLGAFFGAVKIVFITSVLIMFFGATNEEIEIIDKETVENSIIYKPVKSVAPMLLPSILRVARDKNIIDDDVEMHEETI